MKQAILWGVVFAVVALIVFPLIAPLVFRGGNMRQLGAISFPILIVIGGGAGVTFGLTRSRRNKQSK